MRSILAILGLSSRAEETGDEAIRRIAAELDRLEPDRARYIAAFAFVLSRVANADQEVSQEETAIMERLVAEKSGLPHEQAALTVAMARTQQRALGGTEDFLVTRVLSGLASYDQKVAIIDCLFAVAAVDRSIRPTESDEIARIARELRVEQSDLSRIRSGYRDLLSVRQGFGQNERS
jgi:uncharacterized tellurite resistance protein B-like protein